MLVILQGSLRHFPPHELLPFLGRYEHTGTLDIESKGKHSRLFIRAGIIVCGESPDGNDLPAIVASLLSAGDAAFTFLDGLEVPANATETPFAPDALLDEAERYAVIARTFPDGARFSVVENPSQEINLKPEQFKLLFRIGKARTFGELMADGMVSRDDLASSLRALEAAGLIVRSDGAAEPAPAGPRPEVAAAVEQAEAVEPPARGVEPAEKPKPQKRRSGALTSSGPDAAVHPLVGDAFVIGREAGNDIVVSDASVSSKHARITRTDDGFAIEDLGSRNGTFVNGEPVRTPAALLDNDMIRLGKVMFTFNLAAELKRGETTETKFGRS